MMPDGVRYFCCGLDEKQGATKLILSRVSIASVFLIKRTATFVPATVDRHSCGHTCHAAELRRDQGHQQWATNDICLLMEVFI